MKCLKCKHENCKEVTKTRFMVTRGLELEIDGLKNWLCPECGSEFETSVQANENAAKIKDTYILERGQAKEALGLLSGAEIKAIRECYSLTQAEAAKMFGGGLRAFSKYENEEVVQAESMDRLLRCAQEFREVAIWLARRQGIHLESRLHTHNLRPEILFANSVERVTTFGIHVFGKLPSTCLPTFIPDEPKHSSIRINVAPTYIQSISKPKMGFLQ